MKRREPTFRQRLARIGRRIAIVVGAIMAIAFVAGFATLFVWPPINEVVTGATPEYPDIQPQDYRFTRERVFHAAVESLETVDRFTVMTADVDTGMIVATAHTPSGWFVDDMIVRVEANGDGGAIVFAESRSRVGRGDFGQNARNLRTLFEQLDDTLGVD